MDAIANIFVGPDRKPRFIRRAILLAALSIALQFALRPLAAWMFAHFRLGNGLSPAIITLVEAQTVLAFLYVGWCYRGQKLTEP